VPSCFRPHSTEYTCTPQRYMSIPTLQDTLNTLPQTIKVSVDTNQNCNIPTMTAHENPRLQCSLFKLGTQSGWMVKEMPWPLYSVKEGRYLMHRRLGGTQGRSGLVRKVSPPPGFDRLTLQSAVSYYIDRSIPAHKVSCYNDRSIPTSPHRSYKNDRSIPAHRVSCYNDRSIPASPQSKLL
jgi:hypothetical protein